MERMKAIHSFELNGIPLKTGDLICTADGNPSASVIGEFWRVIGKLIPGEVDHVVIYLGPGGRCAEAGPRGVITFEIPTDGASEEGIPGGRWDSSRMVGQRGDFVDKLHGVAYPLGSSRHTEEEMTWIRLDVANFCLRQARKRKPYNLNFLDPYTDKAFYCSQLAYQAYRHHDIVLNTRTSIPNLPFSERIVFPQEIWSLCPERRAAA